MKIISNSKEANFFLHDLSTSLQRDFYAWYDWMVLMVGPQESGVQLDSFMQAHITYVIHTLLMGNEGAVINLEDGSTLILIQKGKGFSVEEFSRQLNHQRRVLVPEMKVEALSAKEDSAKVQAWINPHVDPMTSLFQRPAIHKDVFMDVFPEIANIAKAWAENCKQRATRHKPHLMIIDDDPIARYVVSNAVKAEYPVATASSSMEAIRKHFLLGPDIIFLDIDLPDGNGFEVLDHIRGYDPQCHVVMFSGNGYMENKMKAMHHGACGFISKPFNREHFEHYIKEWKETHHRAQAR